MSATHHLSPMRRRMRQIIVLILLAAPVFLIVIGHYSDLDLVLADFVFDPVGRTFPWRHAWFTDAFGHVILKRILIALAAIPVLLCTWDMIRPIAKWSAWLRLRMRAVALSALCVPFSVSMLKSFSASHCPWGIDRYGGVAPYIRLLEALPDGVLPGHCFPAGHATSALWLVAVALFWWPHRPRMAMLVGLVTLSFGFGVGWMQQMRGAHFLSHTLWSIWLACSIIVVLFAILSRASGLGHVRT